MIASAGGVVGVWTHLSDTPAEYARKIRALADVIGAEHVCIGTDTKLTQPGVRPSGPGPAGPPHGSAGLPGPGGPGPSASRPAQPSARVGERTNEAWADQTVGFYYAVVDAMLKAGFNPEEIGTIGGGNFLRIFGLAVAK
jgi:microsomal dipeptidase-like Zn-dependent dipeptidase